MKRATHVHTMSREHGFTLAELMISMTVTLIAVGAALTTFSQGLIINDSGTQLSDANQNMRAGMNQLVQDLMQAGRIIGPGGISLPSGAGVTAFNRPGPSGTTPFPLTFALAPDTDTSDTTPNLAAITTGYQLVPSSPQTLGSPTDMVTIMTVDEFMPVIQTPPLTGTPAVNEGTINPNGRSVTLPTSSVWLMGDTTNDTPMIQVGDLVMFSNTNGKALVTITSKDTTHIYFAMNDPNDWFGFNQFTAPCVPMLSIKLPPAPPPCPALDTTTTWAGVPTMMSRAMMITYYVDTTTGTSPRLTRVVNHSPVDGMGVPLWPAFAPQALAGVVEDLDLTYDLVDGASNPTYVLSLPCPTVIELVCGLVTPATGVTYNSNQVRKVNVHMGVRSEIMSKPFQDYIRNHIATAVDVRSLASVNRYVTQ
jgi:prepilin-type N-terminal cleavage/methylation domain-containing protein